MAKRKERDEKASSYPVEKAPAPILRTLNKRNLRKEDLGAVIFGCKQSSFAECLTKKIFGLPDRHFSYVKKVTPGLPLFLFNYSDRTLHGIFQAASSGEMFIDPIAWAANQDSCVTPYAAQVRFKVYNHCSPLREEEFRPVIARNYQSERIFWFELDKEQAFNLINLFLSSYMRQNLFFYGHPNTSALMLKPVVKAPARTLWTLRNLGKENLGAVIFGCKNHTMKECLTKRIFGLPDCHFLYVKNVTPGLPLFLFNYSDRTLHGICESASSGEMNIDPKAWVAYQGSNTTPFAAQVYKQCRPLREEEFAPIIASNYQSQRIFGFELDKQQAANLIQLFLSSHFPENLLVCGPPNGLDLVLKGCSTGKSAVKEIDNKKSPVFEEGEIQNENLLQEVEGLKASKLNQQLKINSLELQEEKASECDFIQSKEKLLTTEPHTMESDGCDEELEKETSELLVYKRKCCLKT